MKFIRRIYMTGSSHQGDMFDWVKARRTFKDGDLGQLRRRVGPELDYSHFSPTGLV
jgi:hypothetical protein